jgi:hypothetical protein
MDINLESFLIAILFLLPGFLTSRLILARTPAAAEAPSAFQETAESLLRSAIVHILIAAIALPIVYLLLPRVQPSLLPAIWEEGVLEYFKARQELIPAIIGLWVVLAFAIAAAFGYFWDPLDFLRDKLHRSRGTITYDLMYLLADAVTSARLTDPSSQLWIQVRTSTGHTYQGEFVYGSYRAKDLSRELLMSAVTHFSPRLDKALPPPSELLDYALLDLSKCDGIEAKIRTHASS